MQLETIKIEDPKGKRDFVIINKKDFDPEVHVEFGTRPAPEPEPEPEPIEVPAAPEPEPEPEPVNEAPVRKPGRKAK